MSPEEARWVIAEFMDEIDCEATKYRRVGKAVIDLPDYESLDALVPVWRKIQSLGGLSKRFSINHSSRGISAVFQHGNSGVIKESGENIKEVAVILTAKAIQVVTNE